jgi:hypothetical protein
MQAPREEVCVLQSSLLAGVLGLLSAVASAQHVLLTIPGHAAGDRFGSGLDAVGDVNGDGGLDLAIGAMGACKVFLVRAGDGSTLAQASLAAGSSFGVDLSAVGDANGDGITDVVVGAPEATIDGQYHGGAVYVLSGVDLTTWKAITHPFELEELGSASGAVGDLDLDGWPDFGAASGCITSPFGSGCIGAGFGQLYSAQTVHSISWMSEAASLYRAAGDVNGDGTSDYLGVWAPLSNLELGLLAGPVLGDYPDTLDLLDPVFGHVQAGPAADFDGDGLNEYVFVHDLDDASFLVDVRSGSPPHSVLSFSVPGATADVAAVDARGDVDGDGVPDVLLGRPSLGGAAGPGAGRVQAWSGAEGTPLFTMEGDTFNTRLGARIVVLGDLTGDGRTEFALGAPGSGVTKVGKVLLVSGLPPAWKDVGFALAGAHGEPQLAGYGPLTAGSSNTLRLIDAASNAQVVLVAGLSQIGLAFKGGVLLPAPDFYVAGLSTGALGALKLDFALPADMPALLAAWIQMWIVDAAGPQGLSASNGLQLTTQG